MAGATVAWASSDTAVAAVDAAGQVTAAANGAATITATAGSASGTAAVTVAQVVSAVAVSPAADTLVAFGDTVRLAAEATDAEVPRWVIQPGLEMVIEVDPAGTLDPALGVVKRIPEMGRLAVDVRAMPTFDVTLVPFLWSPRPDSSILTITDGLTTEDELVRMTRTLLPVGDFDLAVHEPVVTSTNHVPALQREAEAIWVAEGKRGYYVGTIAGDFTGTRGIGSYTSRVSVTVLGRPDRADMEYVMAHEIGHTMRLFHPPCGGASSPDPSYPYPDGSIGVWGYDFQDGGSLVEPHNSDLMTYCFRGRHGSATSTSPTRSVFACSTSACPGRRRLPPPPSPCSCGAGLIPMVNPSWNRPS